MDARTKSLFTDSIPSWVVDVCTTLKEAGFQAWAVGGAVRDVLMSKVPQDWDVATDALPEEVMKCFKRVLPTGVEHGTVTVLAPCPKGVEHIEVTTFRGEGDYTDHRRPDQVTFGVPLTEDLARRDFKCNAIAFDPIEQKLFDPFEGQKDIEDRVINAVGDPCRRFDEDGLRVMRALRFQSVLGFSLGEDTRLALEPSLKSFRAVAKERVLSEFTKMIGGVNFENALKTSMNANVFGAIFPSVDVKNFRAILQRATQLPQTPEVQLLSIFWGTDSKQSEKALKTLTVSNQLKKHVVQGLEHGQSSVANDGLYSCRVFLSKFDKPVANDVLKIWSLVADAANHPKAWIVNCEKVLDDNDPLNVVDLKIKGKDLLSECGLKPGPQLGEMLRRCLDCVWEDPKKNQRQHLLDLVNTWTSDN